MSLAHAASDGFEADAVVRSLPGRGGLVSLLAHDLRVPLGPIALATSSLASDPSLAGTAREYARIAFAQSAKVGRLMNAALIASGRVPAMRPVRLSAMTSLYAAAETLQSLGGGMSIAGADVDVVADRALLDECLANLAELAAGSSCRTHATVEPAERVIIGFAIEDPGRCAAAFSKEIPDDADSAFALSTLAVAGAFGGAIELTDAEIVLTLPPAEDE